MADRAPPPADSLRPVDSLQRQQSVHPGLLPSVTEVPVTPGIHLSTYHSEVSPEQHHRSYFTHNPAAHEQAVQDGNARAPSGHDILRRMSLSHQHKEGLLADSDPRVAFPSLSLSGSVISATFCIPHSLHHRKGRAWVSSMDFPHV
jgi:trehalose 6-phosphate synthase/phosphatase